MSLDLYAHPFSSYCQKVLTALYENATPFSLKLLTFTDDAMVAEFGALWPIKRMPLLIDDGRSIMESTIIIEHLALHHPGPVRLIPADAAAALDIRFMDRVFDNYIMTPMQRIVFEAMRPAESRDPFGVNQARSLLDTTYQWLDARLKDRVWAAGDFSLADCAAAPSLFYADWAHPIPAELSHLRAIARACSRAPPSPARSTRRGPIAASFHWAHRTGINQTGIRRACVPGSAPPDGSGCRASGGAA